MIWDRDPHLRWNLLTKDLSIPPKRHAFSGSQLSIPQSCRYGRMSISPLLPPRFSTRFTECHVGLKGHSCGVVRSSIP